MAQIIIKEDLPSSVQAKELVDAMVAGANATAARVAPCLVSTDPAPTDDQLAEAKLVLIGMVSRWADAGSGALASQTAGPFGQTLDTRQKTGYNPWPSEIQRLQGICSTGASGAFSVDTAPSLSGVHADWCTALTYTDATGAVVYGGAYCSCGADIAGYPIYE